MAAGGDPAVPLAASSVGDGHHAGITDSLRRLSRQMSVCEMTHHQPTVFLRHDRRIKIPKILAHLVKRRRKFKKQLGHMSHPHFSRSTFLISCSCPRFANGEGKAVLRESVRIYDIYIITDIGNYGCAFKMRSATCPMSPDDHFQDIKRVVAAIGGRARRINVIMPMLYQSRQHKRTGRESLDCAVALKELEFYRRSNL